MIMCGMGEVDVTPALGSDMLGYFRDRKSTGILDPLYAKALVVESDGTILCIVSVDAAFLGLHTVAAIRERICAHTGIPPWHIMATATHTHTGPPTIGSAFMPADEAYLSWMAAKAADAAVIAHRTRRVAAVGYAVGHEADIAFNRRFRMKDGTVETNPGFRHSLIDKPAGPIDPQVTVIRIDDAAGQPIGVVTNYACHTDTVDGTEYSADYPGELSRTLKRVLGEHIVSLFVMGASGDINHVDFVNRTMDDYDVHAAHYKKMGRILAGEALKTREKISTSPDCRVDVRSVRFPVGLRKPTASELAKAHREMASCPVGSEEYYAGLEVVKAGEHRSDSVEIEALAFRLGDMAVVGLPGELFVEIGLEIKRRSPFRPTMIGSLSNGSVNAYICTEEAYRQGGYETLITSNSNLEEGAAGALIRHSLALLEQLHEAPAPGGEGR